ncbi:MAG TPA: hypothetical protein VGH30_05240 [Jatrophihabitantaceae bacterium]
MTYTFAKRLLDRYPRTSRVIVAACSAVAAVIGLLLDQPIAARLLAAAFYGVIAWLAAASARDLIVGPSHYPPNRFPLPGLWRIRPTSRGVLVPVHLDPSDSGKVRVCSLGFVFAALGGYLAIVARHQAAGTYALTLVICGLLAVICIFGTAPDLYRRAGSRFVLRIDPLGIAWSEGQMAAWREIVSVELVHELVRSPHPRRSARRRFLQVTAHAGSIRIDVTGVSRMRGLVAIIEHYLRAPDDQTTIGSRASLWRMRLQRQVRWAKAATRPDPRGSGRVERTR